MVLSGTLRAGGIAAQLQAPMNAQTTVERPVQLGFPWASERAAIRRRKRRFRAARFNFRWPPRRGDTIYFGTETGVQSGVFSHARAGLVWVDFILENGCIIPEHYCIMCPEPSPWRDPATVTEQEKQEWIQRMDAHFKAGIGPHNHYIFMAELVHFGMHVLLLMKRDREEEEGRSVDLLEFFE